MASQRGFDRVRTSLFMREGATIQRSGPLPIFRVTTDGVEFQDDTVVGTFQPKAEKDGVPLF